MENNADHILRGSEEYVGVLYDFQFLRKMKPIQILCYMMEVVLEGSTNSIRKCAAFLITEDVTVDILSCEMTTLEKHCLRDKALQMLMFQHQDEHLAIKIRQCGIHLLRILINLCMQSREYWHGLSLLIKKAFSWTDKFSLDRVCDIAVDMPLLEDFFETYIYPCVVYEREGFCESIIDIMKRKDDSCGWAFSMLARLDGLLTKSEWNEIMEAAVTSSFSANERRPSVRLVVACGLSNCIKNTRFKFTCLMAFAILKFLKDLFESVHAKERIAAVALCASLLEAAWTQ